MKVVEISIEDFKVMVDEIKVLRRENDELLRAVKYLNAEIRDYNKKFGSKNTKDIEDEKGD